jgi:hypothetical protein
MANVFSLARQYFFSSQWRRAVVPRLLELEETGSAQTLGIRACQSSSTAIGERTTPILKFRSVGKCPRTVTEYRVGGSNDHPVRGA